MNLHDLRRDYARETLDERGVAPDPLAQFRAWFDEAVRAEVPEPNAMTLATATRDGRPSARIVLLKHLDARGFTFFSDYRSRKGREIEANPHGALCFLWHELERQVRIEGRIERVEREESDAYYRSRPIGSRLGAWASEQSSLLRDRADLESRYARAAAQHANEDPPRPPHWGGYRLLPDAIEFWQGRQSRLHDRIRYCRDGERWRIERLSP